MNASVMATSISDSAALIRNAVENGAESSHLGVRTNGVDDVTKPNNTPRPTMYARERPVIADASDARIPPPTFTRCSTIVFIVLIANSASAVEDNAVNGTSKNFGAATIRPV